MNSSTLNPINHQTVMRATDGMNSGRVRNTGMLAPKKKWMGYCRMPNWLSNIQLQTQEEVAAEWREEGLEDKYELFVAERDGRIVGHILLYRRPPDLRVPKKSIDLAQASTEPEARGTGVGRALTAHVIRWANENGIPVMTTDWRMTNLWASRFWPKRGFRPVFLRVYRSIP